MSFLAGAVNSGGFMACERFVTHITGFATLAGIDIALMKWGDAIAALSIPVYFLIGVLIAGWLTEGRLAQGKKPVYPFIMALVTICIGIVTFGGLYGWFGNFGTAANYSDDYLLLALLCGSSGLQNAAITSASRGTLRTTHMTGATTDLGLGIVRSFFLKSEPEQMKYELLVNLRRIASISSFIFGGAISAFLFLQFRYGAFLMPTLIGLYLTIYSYSELSQNQESQNPS
jgi:uncharacterized membrane protein YoaK (UPF0700 family)